MPPRLYLCFEPDCRTFAAKIDAWPVTNADFDAYDRRADIPVGSPAAEPLKTTLRAQIEAADLTICIISFTTHLDDWINWELETSKAGPNRTYFVGILIHEHDVVPAAMRDAGAIIVPFKRDAVQSAIEWAWTEKKTSDDYLLPDV